MKKILLSLLIVGSAYAEGIPPHAKMNKPTRMIDHAGLTREEISMSRSGTDYYIVNDIISKQTVFIPMENAMEYFMKSLNYYNRSLSLTVKKAIERAKKEDKRVYVNIVAGSDIPAHAFAGRNNVYKVDEFPNGQYTVFYVQPNGMISQDHYESGEYGKVGRDGVSFEHAVKTFGATEIRKATKRAEESNKNYDWEVTLNFPDTKPSLIVFDTFDRYEEWFNRTRYSDRYATVKKVSTKLNLTRNK